LLRGKILKYGGKDFVYASADTLEMCIASDFSGVRWLINIVYPRESREFSGASFLVQAFGVASLANIKRGVYVNLSKIPNRIACFASDFTIRRDRRD
jgi:hypothetical protein